MTDRTIAQGTGTSAAPAREYRTVQALRFVAAFAVVVLHSTFYASERLDTTLGVYHAGANGIRLFFVISGFVMIVSSQRLIAAQHGWSVFLTKRIARIVPLYWLVTLSKVAVLLATPAVVLHAGVDWTYIAKSLFFLPATNIDGEIQPILGVGWTLNFEMMFYALFALALLVRVKPLAFVTPVLLALTVASLFRRDAWPDAARFWCDPIVLDFLAGMAIAQATLRGSFLTVRIAAFAAVAGLAYLMIPFPKPDHDTLAGSLATTIAAAAVVFGAVSLEPVMGRHIPRWILFLGTASYSIYLVHPLIAPAPPAMFARLGIAIPTLAVATSVAIALIGGSLCYLFVERSLNRWTAPWVRGVDRRAQRPARMAVSDGVDRP